jgi:hypothetical protein
VRPRFDKTPITHIHNLDDDSLLNVFDLFRPSPLLKDEYGNMARVWGYWDRERWWYRLVQVCRRWRYLIFGSASHLRICLVWTPGMPVANMLAHSPPLPLTIDHYVSDVTAEDEEGILLALQHRERVRRIRLVMPISSLRKLITAIDGEFPALEVLNLRPRTKHDSRLILPSTFEAPQLRYLWLDYFASPIGSRLLTTAVGLVGLLLRRIHPPTYPHPNNLLQALSLLPQLEKLEIGFSLVPNPDVESQLLKTPIVTYAIFPDLHFLGFSGTSAYLEALLPYITTPLLETLSIHFFNQLTFSVPCLLQFMMTTENFKFRCVRFVVDYWAVYVFVYSSEARTEGASLRLCEFEVEVMCGQLDQQVSSVARIFNILSPLFSAVVELTLEYRGTSSSHQHNQADRTQWRELLGSFRNVKTIHVSGGLVSQLSHSLRSDGEPPLELLPELKELVCPVGSVQDKAFVPFIHEREVAGQPVNLIEETFPAGHF